MRWAVMSNRNSRVSQRIEAMALMLDTDESRTRQKEQTEAWEKIGTSEFGSG